MKNQIAQRHLLIWGSDNKITSLKKHGDYHYNYLKSDEFVTIQNAGHLCMYEKPTEVNQLIESYLLINR
jgi:pimeloyl-ACP methyl ester carboxylesterase